MSEHSIDLHQHRLHELSQEVSRIAGVLARLSINEPATETVSPPDDDLPQVEPDLLKAVIRGRQQRKKFMPEELFGEPAWDMMLDLLLADLTQQKVSVSSLCVGSGVPQTTALRWIGAMEEKGLFVRRADPFDKRRFHIELSATLRIALRRYFAGVSPRLRPE